MKNSFTLLIIIFFFICFALVAYGQEEIIGEITYVDSDELAINNTFLKIDKNSNIIYKNQLGSQLIATKDIPLGSFGVAHLENLTIKDLEVSGSALSSKEIVLQETLKVEESIDKFQLSYDGKYFAYYSQEKGKLMVKDVATDNILWQQDFSSAPVFRFNPHYCEIIYAFLDNSFYGLSSYNLLNNYEEILIQKPIANNEYINYFEIAPNGEYIVFTTIGGLVDSQGYVSQIQLINKKDQKKSFIDIANVYSLTWSPDSSSLAFSKYKEPNLQTSQIGYYQLKTNTHFLLEKEKYINQFNPTFTKDGDKFIFTHSENFIDKAILYDLTFNQQIELFEDFNYISNFCWLDDNNLFYTYGDLPQIKLINLSTKETLNISDGYSPQVINNNILYFLKNDSAGNTYLYCFKNK